MKLLMIGGTQFVGRFMTEVALANGHDVTLFNRGKTNPDLFPNVEKIIGDRDGDLDKLAGRTWDAVIDTSGYVPRIVRASAEALKGSTDNYIFISSISVYADMTEAGLSETKGDLQTLDDETDEKITGENYGGLKVLCEKVVEEVFPDNHLIIRPGLIVGPYDPTYRFNYWLTTISEGDETLAPISPDHPVQFIDARDLADWTIQLMEKQETGLYNATGPVPPITFGDFLETCRQAIKPEAVLTWASEEFLLEQGVNPWQDLPFWMPKENWGAHQIDVSKAVDAGLSFRPLADTIIDTTPYAQQMAMQIAEKLRDGQPMRSGITTEREHDLLAAWHQQGH